MEKIKEESSAFKNWVLENVKSTQPAQASDIKFRRQDAPELLPSIHEALSKTSYEDSVDFVQPYVAISELRHAVSAKSNLGRERAKGMRNVGRNLEKFASAFLSFLQACKGIVNIAGTADSGLVGTAYETLCVLFTVRNAT